MGIKEILLKTNYVQLKHIDQFLVKYHLKLVLKLLLFNELQNHRLKKKLFCPEQGLDNNQQNFAQITSQMFSSIDKYITQYVKNL